MTDYQLLRELVYTTKNNLLIDENGYGKSVAISKSFVLEAATGGPHIRHADGKLGLPVAYRARNGQIYYRESYSDVVPLNPKQKATLLKLCKHYGVVATSV